MDNPIVSLIDAIELLADKINSKTTPDEALKYTQAALNLAHTAVTLDTIERGEKVELEEKR